MPAAGRADRRAAPRTGPGHSDPDSTAALGCSWAGRPGRRPESTTAPGLPAAGLTETTTRPGVPGCWPDGDHDGPGAPGCWHDGDHDGSGAVAGWGGCDHDGDGSTRSSV